MFTQYNFLEMLGPLWELRMRHQILLQLLSIPPHRSLLENNAVDLLGEDNVP